MKQYYDIVVKVSKRKYDVDEDKLKEVLSKHKKESHLSNIQIAESLEIPKTMAEHWFRKDRYFTIPPKELWLKLKELLKIQTDEFDEQIMEFVEEDGTFDMGNRVYPTNGICPAIISNSEIKIYDNRRENR